MPDQAPDIRSAARALIVRDDCLLMLRKEYEDGRVRFALPGGAQEYGETLGETLERECEEEIGTPVTITGLAYVAEYFRKRESVPGATRHLLECLFRCEVPAGYVPANGRNPDKHQVGVVWLPVHELDDHSLSHPFLSDAVALGQHPDIYLGIYRDDDAGS